MWEGKVMATGSKRGSSADAALLWKKIMQAVGFAGYVTKQGRFSFPTTNGHYTFWR